MKNRLKSFFKGIRNFFLKVFFPLRRRKKISQKSEKVIVPPIQLPIPDVSSLPSPFKPPKPKINYLPKEEAKKVFFSSDFYKQWTSRDWHLSVKNIVFTGALKKTAQSMRIRPSTFENFLQKIASDQRREILWSQQISVLGQKLDALTRSVGSKREQMALDLLLSNINYDERKPINSYQDFKEAYEKFSKLNKLDWKKLSPTTLHKYFKNEVMPIKNMYDLEIYIKSLEIHENSPETNIGVIRAIEERKLAAEIRDHARQIIANNDRPKIEWYQNFRKRYLTKHPSSSSTYPNLWEAQ